MKSENRNISCTGNRKAGEYSLVLFLYFSNYRSKFHNEETVMFCLRVMVGVIVLYDHVHPVGAFCKSSTIDVSTVPTLAADVTRPCTVRSQ